MERTPSAGRHCGLPGTLGCVLALLVAMPAAAQTVYRWTDAQGVVHFSDMPPAHAAGVEERTLSVQPVVRGAAEPTPAGADEPAGGSAEAAGQPGAAGPPPAGPARVVVVARDTPRTSPSALRVTGRVRNAGAATAANVSVEITVVDETQGTVCLRTAADVDPPTLAGGESGTFDLALDDPCLFGTPNLDIEPRWD